jgi:hypothetical protein
MVLICSLEEMEPERVKHAFMARLFWAKGRMEAYAGNTELAEAYLPNHAFYSSVCFFF